MLIYNKRTLFTLLCFFTVTNFVTAQSDILIGLKGGFGLPGLTLKSSNPVIDGFKTNTTPVYGLVLETQLSNRFSLVSEFNYAELNITKDGNQVIPKSSYSNLQIAGATIPAYLYADFKSHFVMKYLEIPLMLKYQMPINESLDFYVNAGPFAGILINGNVDTEGFGKIYTNKEHTKEFSPIKLNLTQEQDITTRLNQTNIGIQSGIGLLYKTGFGKLIFAANSTFGFIPIQASADDGKNNTRGLNLSLGYLFPLTRSRGEE